MTPFTRLVLACFSFSGWLALSLWGTEGKAGLSTMVHLLLLAAACLFPWRHAKS